MHEKNLKQTIKWFRNLYIFKIYEDTYVCSYLLDSPYSQGWCRKILILRTIQPSNSSLNLTSLRIGTPLALSGSVHFWDWGLRLRVKGGIGIHPKCTFYLHLGFVSEISLKQWSQSVGRGPLVGRRGTAGGPWEVIKIKQMCFKSSIFF